MKFLYGPWIWDPSTPEFPNWRAPVGFSGVELRTYEEQTVAGGSPGFGVFCGDSEKIENASDYILLGEGSWNEIKPDTKVIEAIKVRKGYSLQGETLQQLLLDLFIGNSDPDGLETVKPLLPDGNMFLKLITRGNEYSEKFVWGGPRTDKIQALIKRDFAKAFEAANNGELKDSVHHLRILDALCEQYKLKGQDEWKLLVPAELVADIPGPIPHETTISDNFNRADSSSLGTASGGFTYTDYVTLGSANGIVSNKVSPPLNSICYSRADSDLSSDNHYSQIVVDTIGSGGNLDIVGSCARFSSSANDNYTAYFRRDTGKIHIGSVAAGTATEIDSVAITFNLPEACRIEVNGSTITGFQAGVSRVSATNTTYSGQTRTGFLAVELGTSAIGDDFEAGDLGGGAPFVAKLPLIRSIAVYRSNFF